MTDGNDSDLCNQIITAQWDAMGISNFSQAQRMLLLGLNRGIEGNQFVEFETSVKALGLMPGDLITVTYQKENFERTPFRIQKISPGPSFRTAIITAQLHNDAWYSDTASGIISGRGWQSGESSGLPAPVGGTVIDSNGNLQLGITETEITATDGSTDVELTVAFTEPSGLIGVLPAPLVNLVANVNSTGGTLAGGTTWFYALSTIDSGGGESPLSFIVQASTGAGANTNSVQLSGIGLPVGATAFNVYRGLTPQQLFRIASNQTPATTYTDAGAAAQTILPPDPQFDHVDLYWRWELVPEAPATTHSSTTVGNSALALPVNQYQSAIVRITRGTGAGQEQQIASNTATVLTVGQPWTVEPDSTSFFAVAENSWRAGNSGKSSPLTIDLPERVGNGIHVSARAANASGIEASYELSPLTRWILGESGTLAGDVAVPSAPLFAIAAFGDGTAVLAGIAFTTLHNTTSISSGTYTFHYYDEINGAAGSLTAAIGIADTSIQFTGTVASGTLLQIDQEIILTGATASGATSVTRAMHGTLAAAHLMTTPWYRLSDKVVIVPFIKNFFGTPASGEWSSTVALADVRIASVELYMTNLFGASPSTISNFTNTNDSGLRTLAGGQYSFQITGYLAVQTGAAPNIIVDAPRSIEDIYAVLRTPSSGSGVTLEVNVNGQPYATVQFDPNAVTSYVVPGFGLPALTPGDQLSLDVTGVGTTNPGSDLTVIIRL